MNEVAKLTNLKGIMEWLPKSNYSSRATALKQFTGRATEFYLAAGAILCKARDEEDWVRADCRNFFEWVQNEEKISRAHAQRMMYVWEILQPFIQKKYDLIINIDFTKLAEITPVIKLLTFDQAIDLLHSAETNTVRGLKDNIREIKGKPAQDNCDCMVSEIHFRCKRCGKWVEANIEVTKEEIGRMKEWLKSIQKRVE